MRKLSWVLLAFFLFVALQTLTAIVLSEGALHLTHKPLTASMRARAENEARDMGVKMDDAQIASFDGTQLKAWFFRPEQGNGEVVVVLHGHNDNRAAAAGFAPMLLQHHYAVLAPDARVHGESGGDIATYGIYESRDLSRWVDWLNMQNYHGCVYGLGESMGAAILLQTLPIEPRFCAAVADSPYSSFREVAADRLAQRFGDGSKLGRTLVAPLVSEAFLYARLRYGIDFDKASPANAVALTRVPVLLIHGADDFNIPLRHCQAILKNHAGEMEFWEVPGAGHTAAFGTEPEEFERRVTGWFTQYSHK
jgi:dipeptidyl aminopeptidase/acylaminoacyl peptidase